MGKRIRMVRKDSSNVIVKIRGLGWEESTESAVRNIKYGWDSYYVEEVSPKADVHVYADKYLRTDKDASSKNNLDNLPTF